MNNRFFTILIVPERQGKSKTIQVSRRHFFLFALVVIAALTALSALFLHYFVIVGQSFELSALREEKFDRDTQLKQISDKMFVVGAKLAELRTLEDKLRGLTGLNDPTRGLKLPPLQKKANESQWAHFENPTMSKLEGLILDSRLIGYAEESAAQTASLTELVDYFSKEKAILSSTPSISPTEGSLTSPFGGRSDPYTGGSAMHLGLDISADIGTKVLATANGRVIFAGINGLFGNLLVIDHGRGITTRYAHLKEFLVKIGQSVQRGQEVALVGNTGRSTGPHLHYEVRRADVPVDPQQFILQ